MKGETLIELMLAIMIGLLLIGLLLEIYLGCEKTYRWQSEISMVTNNARSAINILQTDIKLAGYIGCARLTADFPLINHTEQTLTAKNKLHLTNNTIVIRHASLINAALVESMRDAMILHANKKMHVNKGDVLIVSNCQYAEIFIAKEVGQSRDVQIILSSSPLNYLYGKDAELSRLEVNQYFVAKISRKDMHGKPIYALYLKDIKQHKTELIENINNMQFAYLLDKDGKLNEVMPNDAVDMGQVLGVKAALQFVTPSFTKTWYAYAAI